MSKRVICQAGWIGNMIVNVFSRLEGRKYSTGYGYDRCHRTATHRFSSGCVHEHLMTWVVCERCADALLSEWREYQQDARCPACKYADGHICPVLASAEEGILGGPAEAVAA